MGEHGGRGGDGVHGVNLFSFFSYIIQDKREIVNGFDMLNLRILKYTYLSIITDFTITNCTGQQKNFQKPIDKHRNLCYNIVVLKGTTKKGGKDHDCERTY